MTIVAAPPSHGFGRRLATITIAYCLSCLVGAAAMLAYLVVWLERGSPLYVEVAGLVGLIGGVTALPVAAPLIYAAERWSWRNALIYALSALFIWFATLSFGIILVEFAPWAMFSDWENLRINPAHAFHPLAVNGYLISTAAAVGSYWVLHGRISGMRA